MKTIKVQDSIMSLRGKEMRLYLALTGIFDWNNPKQLQKLPTYEELSKMTRIKIHKIETVLFDLREYMCIDVEFGDDEYCDCLEFFRLIDDKELVI